MLVPFQAKMVQSLAKEPSARLLKHVVRCYLRLSDNPRYARFTHCFYCEEHNYCNFNFTHLPPSLSFSLYFPFLPPSLLSLSLLSPKQNRAREALRQCLPDQLKDATFSTMLKEDSTTKKWVVQLLSNLGQEMVAISDSRPAPPPTSHPHSQ